DPLLLLSDLLDLTHFLTRLSISPSLAEDVALPEMDRRRGAALAEKLSIPTLGRCWQMLMKGAQEVKQAPNTFQALEMVLIRLAYVAELPAPEEILRGPASTGPSSPPPAPKKSTPVSAPAAAVSTRGSSAAPARQPGPAPISEEVPNTASEPT